MTPSEQCKAAWLKSLAELAKITSRQDASENDLKSRARTLFNWSRDKPELFATILDGAVKRKLEIITPENKCPACQGTGRVKP